MKKSILILLITAFTFNSIFAQDEIVGTWFNTAKDGKVEIYKSGEKFFGQIVWLKDAKTDLKEIYDYIALDSKRYARLQVERIKESIKVLKIEPQIGKLVHELNQPEIREMIEGNYRIIYRLISTKKIHILMVHHGARDLQRRIK